mmetsp:Transcript_494/g.1013  ORF Transcript_494/g.1013 Transcript_494/m.1013 type:complete len:229 (+) Transcript_494:3-689(+)
MLGMRAHTCLQALKTGTRQLGGHPVTSTCMQSSGGAIAQRLNKAFPTSPLVRNMCAASNEVKAGGSGEDAVDTRRIRPVVTPAERRKEIFLYKQQVHELRVQYKKEWEEKVVANEKLRAERAAEFWSKVEEYRRIRDEKAKVRRTIAEETMARLREEKAAEKVEKRERHASWKTTQVDKSRERFSMQLIESRDWTCEKDEVYQLVHEALVDPAKPRYVNPARRYAEDQ